MPWPLSPAMLSSVLTPAPKIMVAGTPSTPTDRRRSAQIQSWQPHPAERLPSIALPFPASPACSRALPFPALHAPLQLSPLAVAPGPRSAPALRAAVSHMALFPSQWRAE